MDRDYRGKEAENAAEIVALDKADILTCDAMIANVRTLSVGTSMEILFAHMHGVPVITVVNMGPTSPWIWAHSLVTKAEVDAVELLADFGVRDALIPRIES